MSRGRGALLLLKSSFSRLALSPSPPSRITLSLSSAPLLTRFFSSSGHFPETKPTAVSSPEDGASDGADGITTEELKKRIRNYMDGDMDVLPLIFEAILERKLSGKHNDTDDELMEELRSKMPHTSDNGEEEDEDDFTSDEDDEEDSDTDTDTSSSKYT